MSSQDTTATTQNEVPLFTEEGPAFYDRAFEHNRSWAQGAPYRWVLNAADEFAFRQWVATWFVPFDPDSNRTDYDMRGYWFNTVKPLDLSYALGQHFPDKWKTPYDTSFSAESIYAKAGCPFHWKGDKLYNDKTGELIFWAMYEGKPGIGKDEPAITRMERSKIDPKAVGTGFLGDLKLDELKLYLGGKLRLRADDQITDARVTMTIEGSSVIEIDLNDDDRAILRSGTLSDVLDLKIDGLWWRLTNVKKDTGDQLTLVFETREIAILRLQMGFIMAQRHNYTRAEFILRLIREITPIVGKVPVVIPELHMIQPIEQAATTSPWGSTGAAGQQGIVQGQQDANPWDKKGLPGTKEYASKNLTVKGGPVDPEQIYDANAILGQCMRMGVSYKLALCSIMAAITESELKNVDHGDQAGPDSRGLFQQRDSWGSLSDRMDPATATAMFIKSARVEDRKNPNLSYGELCQEVQGSAYPDRYALWQGEAVNWLVAYGIPAQKNADLPFDFSSVAPIPGGAAGLHTAATTTNNNNNQRDSQILGDHEPGSDYFFYRGIPDDGTKNWQLEDSWTCIQRLANEVQWRAFFRLGVFWYISEDDLFLLQQPIMNITESSAGIADISFDYDRAKRYAQVNLTVRIGRWQAPPGSIVILQDMGPVNGKWIVSEFDRGMMDLTADVTLKKPLPALPEPLKSDVQPPAKPESTGTTKNDGSNLAGAYDAPLPSPPLMKDRVISTPEQHSGRNKKTTRTTQSASLPASSHPVMHQHTGSITGYPHLTASNADTDHVSTKVLDGMEHMAVHYGVTITIQSGYRDPAYSAQVGGYSTDPHSRGVAVDASVGGVYIGTYIRGRGDDPVAMFKAIGLESGDQPGFYQGGTDAMHVQIPGSGVDKSIVDYGGGDTAPAPTDITTEEDWESNQAYDLKAAPGTAVYAVEAGKLPHWYLGRIENPTPQLFGAQVHLDGIDGVRWFYTHLLPLPGISRKVESGQQIGTVALWLDHPESSHLHIGCNSRSSLDRMVEST